jgi:hypothetical protein
VAQAGRAPQAQEGAPAASTIAPGLDLEFGAYQNGADSGTLPPRAETREEDMAGPPSELLRDRLRSRSPYWVATMHKVGIVCALTLSIFASGYRLEWEEAMGPPAPGLSPNAKSAFTAPEFVSAAIAEGV